jgi:hypothetical protein
MSIPGIKCFPPTHLLAFNTSLGKLSRVDLGAPSDPCVAVPGRGAVIAWALKVLCIGFHFAFTPVWRFEYVAFEASGGLYTR